MRMVVSGAAALTLFLVGLALTGTALAKPNLNNAWTNLQVELEAELTDPEPEAQGEVGSQAKIHKGALQLNRFRAKIEIPIPSPGLGLPDLDALAQAEVELVLSRAGVPYATCMLGLAEITPENGAFEAEFKLDVRLIPSNPRSGGPKVKSKYGTCIPIGGGDPLVPVVASGDEIIVNLLAGEPPVVTPFLQGVFPGPPAPVGD